MDVTEVVGGLLGLTREAEMDCDTFLELLAAKVDGMLPAELEALFEHHRQICPECEEELQALFRALGTDVMEAS